MLSVDAVQLRVAPLSPTGAATRPLGREGATLSVGEFALAGPTGLFPHDATDNASTSGNNKRMFRHMGTLAGRGPARANLRLPAFRKSTPQRLYRRHMTAV